MIWGRPPNLWLGVVTSGAGVAGVVMLAAGLDPEFVAQILAALVTFLGAIIALIAAQPPTIAKGDRIHVGTPNGQPTATATIGLTPAGQVTVQPERRH